MPHSKSDLCVVLTVILNFKNEGMPGSGFRITDLRFTDIVQDGTALNLIAS
jgi:hypothetical protein